MKKLHNPLLPKKGGLGVLALFGILFIALIATIYFWPTDEIVAKPTIVEQQINTAITQQLAEKKAETDITSPITGVISLDEPKPKIDPELVKELKELKRQNKHKRITVLVELKDEKALEAVKQAGGTVQQNFDIGNVAVVEVQSDKIEELSNSAGIEQVSSEKEYVAFLADRIPAFSIDASAWANNITGKGVKIAILDTGVGPHNRISVAAGASFVNGENESDQNGHGTHVAGIAQGVAKDSTIYNAKVLNKAGAGTTSQIIAGINWAVEQNVDIISMSFGGMFTELDGPLASAVKDAINRGVVFVVAAGNCKTGCGGFYGVTTPGNVKEVITVGAVDDGNTILPFSSGDTFNGYIKPDVVGPGKNITSTWLNNGEKTISGTSMSTPFVAGIAALLLEKESGLTNAQVKERLEATAIDAGTPGKDTSYGAGVVDAPELLNFMTLPDIQNENVVNNTNTTNEYDEEVLILHNIADVEFTNLIEPQQPFGKYAKGARYQKGEDYWARAAVIEFETASELQKFITDYNPYDQTEVVKGYTVYRASRQPIIFWTHGNKFYYVLINHPELLTADNPVLVAYVAKYYPENVFTVAQQSINKEASPSEINLFVVTKSPEFKEMLFNCADACDGDSYKTDLPNGNCHNAKNYQEKGTTYNDEECSTYADYCSSGTTLKEYFLKCDQTSLQFCACGIGLCLQDETWIATKPCTDYGSDYVCSSGKCVQQSPSCDYSPTCTTKKRACTSSTQYDLSNGNTACQGGCDGTYTLSSTTTCSGGRYCQGTTTDGTIPCYACSTTCDGSCQSSACSGTDPDCTSSGGVNPNACTCTITSASWSPSGTVQDGTAVQMNAFGTSSCSGKSADFEIWEDDPVGDDYVNTYTDSTFSGGKFSFIWNAAWQNDGVGDPEFYFIATPSLGTGKTSGLLTVTQAQLTCNNNGICDSGENSNNCPNDCVVNPCNNNGACEAGETNSNCPNDCTVAPTCTDTDGDGYGSPGSAACSGGSQTDCNDNNANVHPGASENCNDNLDNNCDGQTNENCCGNGQCNTFENPTNCNQDCYGNLQVISIVNAPSEVDQGQSVQITAQVKNLGTYSQTLKIEAGIAPDYWQGTIFGQDVNAQSYFTVTKCCAGNDYYDAKQITLNAGESENVIFNVKAPTISSKDACSTSNVFKSAWDSSHTVVVGLYSACGAGYTDKDSKDIHVKDKPCTQPSNCNTATEYCKFVGTTGTCQPKICSDKCTSNAIVCNGNTVQHCEDINGDGCVEWKDALTCKSGYSCVSGACEYTNVKTGFSLEDAGSNLVLKQHDDVVSANLKYVASEPIMLEYDLTKFQLDTTTCPASSFTITGDKKCKFRVIGTSGESSIKLKYGGNGRIKIIQNPTGIILTDKQKLAQRYPGAQNQVKDLLQKSYSFALNKNLVVYDLHDYIGTSPLWSSFGEYAEQPFNPFKKNNAYSLEVGQLVREKCIGACKNTIILGDDFVVPHYRRDAQFLNNYWIFGQTERVDHIYSDLPYIERKDKPFSQFKDLFYFDGEHNGKKVVVIMPDSLSSSMQTELDNFKQVLTTKFNPNFVTIPSNTVYCNDGTFFSKFDGSTLLVVGTPQNNQAYNCMPFASELESSDTAFIEVNPWDGANYAIVVNTDDSKVLQAFNTFIETNKFEKATTKLLWWVETGLDVASYLSVVCSFGSGLPCDNVVEAASSGFYCFVKGSVPLCTINTVMMGVQYVPAAPVKNIAKRFLKETGEFAAKLIRDNGEEIVNLFARAFKRGKLDEVFEVLKKMSNCFSTAEYSIQSSNCPAGDFFSKFVSKRPRHIVDKALEVARADDALLTRISKTASTINIADKKLVRMLDSEIPVLDNQVKNFKELADVDKPRVGTVDIDGTIYFFKRNEGLQKDMYEANVRENVRHRLNYVLDEADSSVIIPKTRMMRNVEIKVDEMDGGILVEKIEGKDAMTLYLSEQSRYTQNPPMLTFFKNTKLISLKQKDTMQKMIVRDFIFGAEDRNLANAIISSGDKVGFIDFEHQFVDMISTNSKISSIFNTPPTVVTMLNNDAQTIIGSRLTNHPPYRDLAERWTYGPQEQKKILDLLSPEVDKLRQLTDDDIRAIFELADVSDQAALQQAREILIGPNGRIKKFIVDFDKTKTAVEALQ